MGRKTGRNLNPADQYRKEQHKKEIKKNKQDRKKVRELGSAIKDTTTEGELAQYEELEKSGRLDKDAVNKLAELRERMAKIIEIKKAHGIKIKSKKIEPEKPTPVAEPARDPTRSIYYDPILNPYGAPPPGQPYLEYPPEVPFMQDFPPGVAASSSQQLHPGTAVEPEDASDSDDSDSSSDSDSDSDSSDSDSEDDDEDFMPPLPEGPAPSKDVQQRHLAPSIPAPLIQPRIQGHQQQQPQFMQGTHYPPTYPQGMHGPPGYDHPMNHQRPPPVQGYPPGYWQQGYGRPPGIWNGNPAGPGGYGGQPPFYGHHSEGGYQGRPHPGEGYAREDYPPPGTNSRPSRPPARFVKPPRSSNPQSDPMTGHLPPDEKELNKKRDADGTAADGESNPVSTPSIHPLPPKPTTASPAIPSKPVVAAGPTSISAEPQLRNLQKELVHLVPSSIMRKRVAQKGKIGRPVNAAPVVADDEASPSSLFNRNNADDRIGDNGHRETGLGLLLPKINSAPNVPAMSSGPRQIVVNSAPEVPIDRAAKKKAEYDAFLEGLEGDGLL